MRANRTLTKPKRTPPDPTPSPPGAPKDRMVIYVPPGVRTAVKNWATEGKRSASDVFVEAVREYLVARGVSIDDRPPAAPDARAGATASIDPLGLGEAPDRQAVLIEELLVRFDEAVPRPVLGGVGDKPAGTTVAQGMTVLLAALKAAGDVGLDNAGIRTVMTAGSISSGSSETAKAVLRDAGMIKKAGRNWVLATA